jgi:hypothetical protein
MPEDIKVYLYERGKQLDIARLNMIQVPNVGELIQVNAEDESPHRYRIIAREWMYRLPNRTQICMLLVEPVTRLFNDFAEE